LKSPKNDFSGNFRENHPDDPGRAWVTLKSAENHYSGNFRENRPVSIQLVLNSP
ncbi:hypothetical protein T11_8071, partial [Trichinella zimbabwensis]